MSQLSVEKSENIKKYFVKESKLEKKEKSEKNVRTRSQTMQNYTNHFQTLSWVKAVKDSDVCTLLHCSSVGTHSYWG